MNIRIPRRLVDAWETFHAWGYQPIHQIGTFKLRRIDIVLAVLFVVCVSYYWSIGGWHYGLVGALAFALVAMVALWL